MGLLCAYILEGLFTLQRTRNTFKLHYFSVYSHCVIILPPQIYPATILATQVMLLCIPEHLCAVAKGELCDWGNRSS